MGRFVEEASRNNSLSVALVVVGNEVLSGDTLDTNGNYLAKRLAEIGHRLELIVTIRDSFDAFDEFVSPIVRRFDIVFTSGGIGPTPDDITRDAMARIFGARVVENADALAMLCEFYGDRMNDNARRMAFIPDGAVLVPNLRTGAPGFRIGNVYCFAGVPQIFQDMFEAVAPSLGGIPYHRREFTTNIGESRFSHVMRDACARFPFVEIGSYPRLGGEYRVKLVFKGRDADAVDECSEYLRSAIEEIERAGN
jgi:molybdenum cofactor synthesis domain-containing protein